MHSINFTKQLTQTVQAQLAVQELGFQRNLERRRAQYQNGLAGKRLGSKYVVPRGEIDVQLTEDLSESLRRMKVCLFSERPEYFFLRRFIISRWKGISSVIA